MMHIEIDRIQIALYGVCSQLAEAAAADLDAELKRRLGVFPRGDMAAFDTGEVAIGSVDGQAVLDAAALRGIIADRIVQVIRHRMAYASQSSSPTSDNTGGT